MKTLGELKAESKPETLLRRRERAEEERLQANLQAERQRILEQKKSRIPQVKTAASFIAQNRTKRKSEKALIVRSRRQRLDIPQDGRLLFAIRLHVSVHAANQIKKALHRVRLFERYTGVFLKADEETSSLLKTAEPFIAFGTPSKEMVDKLIRKRARIQRGGDEVILKDNTFVEESLGAQDILCIDDLIYEISEVTDKFEVANKFLRPFKLNPPKEKFSKQSKNKGGDFGNWAEEIDSLIDAMT